MLATPKGRKVRHIHAQEPILVSSSDSEDEVPTSVPEADPLLYSPVKVSHTIIDLTHDSDEECDDVLPLNDTDRLNQKDEPTPLAAKPRPKPRPLAKGTSSLFKYSNSVECTDDACGENLATILSL